MTSRSTFTERRDVSKLLKKLRKGQDDLKKSLQILDDEEMQNVRRQQVTRRHLAEKPINSVKDVCKKRARVELMSPGTEPKVTGNSIVHVGQMSIKSSCYTHLMYIIMYT